MGSDGCPEKPKEREMQNPRKFVDTGHERQDLACPMGEEN
jgi:hypothetical protein